MFGAEGILVSIVSVAGAVMFWLVTRVFSLKRKNRDMRSTIVAEETRDEIIEDMRDATKPADGSFHIDRVLDRRRAARENGEDAN